jgi:hypothetical protein
VTIADGQVLANGSYEPHPWCQQAGPSGGTQPRILMPPATARGTPAPIPSDAQDAPIAVADGTLVVEIDPRTHDLLGTPSRSRIAAPVDARTVPPVAALSAKRRELVFFGEPQAASDRFAVRIVDLDTGAIRARVTPSLARGVGAYAAIYHRVENAYFLLEEAIEVDARIMRLVRVDASGLARVVGTWPFTGTWRKYALDVEGDGELAITAQAPTRHGVISVRTRRHLPVLVRSVVVIDEPLDIWTERPVGTRPAGVPVPIERLF